VGSDAQPSLIPILRGRRKPTQNKRLDERIGHVGGDIDAKGPEDQSRATVLLWIIGFGDGTRGQIPSQAGIVRLPAPVIALADERVAQCVDGARPVCARALVEVARVLMQDRGQNRPADHDIRQAIRIVGGWPIKALFWLEWGSSPSESLALIPHLWRIFALKCPQKARKSHQNAVKPPEPHLFANQHILKRKFTLKSGSLFRSAC